MPFPEFQQGQGWLEGNVSPNKQLLAGAGNAPGVTRAGLGGLRDSKEGTQRKPSAPRTHFFIQRSLLQWDGLLGLATFVEPKPLHKNGLKNEGAAAEGLPGAKQASSSSCWRQGSVRPVFVPGLPLCNLQFCHQRTKKRQGSPQSCPAFLTSEIGGSTMVSLRNFTITNFFRAIRFFL